MRYASRHSLPKQRIGYATAILMIAVAFILDGLQLIPKLLILMGGGLQVIPVLGQIFGGAGIALGVAMDATLPIVFSTFGYFCMWLWFAMEGVGIFKGNYMTRKALTFGGTLLLEVLPFINALPGITLWTFLTIRATRREDREARATIQKKIDAEEQAHLRMLRAQSAERI